jgi:AraC-like DNA-binding protein
MPEGLFLNLGELIPVVRIVNHYKATPHWYLPPRVIFDHELAFAAKGKATVQLGKTTYHIGESDLLFVRPNIVNWWKADPQDPCELLCIHFDPLPEWNSYRERTPGISLAGLEDIRIPDHMVIQEKDSYVQKHFTLLEEFLDTRPFRSLVMKNLLTHILVQLYRELGGTHTLQKSSDRRTAQITPALQYMQTNYHLDITSKDLASIAGFHPTYFCRLFRKVTGKTPTEYLTQIRMKQAKQLLLYTTKSVQEIAQTVGYNSIYYFSRLFKQKEGMTPTEFRHSYLEMVTANMELPML